MPKRKAPPNLQDLLNELAQAGRAGDITVQQLLAAIGRRSFAPLLLLASLIGFTPLGVVPGVPTVLAVFVVLIAAQLAVGRHHVWLPAPMLKLHLEGSDLTKAAEKLTPFARWVDRLICPRLTFLTEPPFASAVGVVCILLALTVPPLELVPLVDIPLWGALVVFSLALFAHDGVLAIAAMALTVAGIALSVAAFL